MADNVIYDITKQEHDILMAALYEFDTVGKTDLRCPRCDGEVVYKKAGTKDMIYCSENCGAAAMLIGI